MAARALQRVRHSPWLWITAVLLLAASAYLWASRDKDVIAELEAALSAAESRPHTIDADGYARRLREHLARQPGDARAWTLYARMQAELSQFGDAARGYEKALGLSPKVAKDPAVWCEYADVLAMTQGGKLAGKPRELVDSALALDHDFPKALEMAGGAEYELGRYREALGYWRPLLAKLPPGSKMHQELTVAIQRTERLAGEPPVAAGKIRY